MENRVIALGFFDGVHIGHAKLLRKTVELAEKYGVLSCVLTFDTHPDQIIHGNKIPLINTASERAEMIKRMFSVDEVILEHFDKSFMCLSWQDYINEILVKQYGSIHVIAGYNHRFGYHGEGTTDKLKNECSRIGIGCDIIDQVQVSGVPVSSTYIRSLIAEGNVYDAAALLGHPHEITGIVEQGKQLGRKLGIPTVNIKLSAEVQTPAFGVYISQLELNRKIYRAITNIGINPTVNDSGTIKVETHILDFNDDLYGHPIRIQLLKHIRPEKRFDSVEDLKTQILSDILTAKNYK